MKLKQTDLYRTENLASFYRNLDGPVNEQASKFTKAEVIAGLSTALSSRLIGPMLIQLGDQMRELRHASQFNRF